MPKGHPHVSWAHVGAIWPAVPASDDAIQPPAVEHWSRGASSSQLRYQTLWLKVCVALQHLHASMTSDTGHFEGM